MAERWWEVTKIKRELDAMQLCECKTEMKGRWLIVDHETLEWAYICARCKRRIYAKNKK